MNLTQPTPRDIACTTPPPPRENRIFLALQWHIPNTADLVPIHGLAATYTDACRLESPNGSEYSGIGARIRNSWRLTHKSLGTKVTEGNSV